MGCTIRALLCLSEPSLVESPRLAECKWEFDVKKALKVLLAVLGMALGIGMILYPYVSDYFEKQYQSQVIVTQSNAVSGQSEDEIDAARQAALDYNNRLANAGAVVTDPFDASKQIVTSDEYESLMNLNGDGVMGTIVIPAIGVKLPIYHTTNDDVLQQGVGHMEATSLPYGGESSHIVLAGHNGIPSVKIFDDLDQLKVGDYFVLQVLGEDHAYRVTSIETVLPDETDSLKIQEGKDLCTLVTCTPYGINTHRLLVHAERCDLPEEWTNGDDKDTSTMPSPRRAILPFTLAGFAIAIGILAGIYLRKRSKRNKAQKRDEAKSDSAPNEVAPSNIVAPLQYHSQRAANPGNHAAQHQRPAKTGNGEPKSTVAHHFREAGTSHVSKGIRKSVDVSDGKTQKLDRGVIKTRIDTDGSRKAARPKSAGPRHFAKPDAAHGRRRPRE
jgi:sortase A